MSATEPAATTPGRAARAYRAYEAYVMAAPDDLEFAEWDELPGWQQEAIDAAVQAGVEASPQRVPELGAVAYEAAENAPLRARIAELERLLAEAVDPTAGDYDNAAEIMRLRDERDRLADALAGNPDPLVAFSRSQVEHFRELVAEILAERPAVTEDERQQIDEWRKRAGLEG